MICSAFQLHFPAGVSDAPFSATNKEVSSSTTSSEFRVNVRSDRQDRPSQLRNQLQPMVKTSLLPAPPTSQQHNKQIKDCSTLTLSSCQSSRIDSFCFPTKISWRRCCCVVCFSLTWVSPCHHWIFQHLILLIPSTKLFHWITGCPWLGVCEMSCFVVCEVKMLAARHSL